MIIEHKYTNQKPVPSNIYNIDECVKIYDRYKNGFFSKQYDEEFSEAQCIKFAKYLASFIIGSCFYYGNTHDDAAYVTLPGFHKIKGNVLTIYWTKVYDYGSAFMAQEINGTRPLPIMGTVDDVIAYLDS